MAENKKIIPENTENKLLTDDQLEKVSGGECRQGMLVQGVERCSADPTHIYAIGLDACPVCGAKKYSDIR